LELLNFIVSWSCVGISFTPREIGDHFVTILRNGQPIPGSPFKVVVGGNEIGDASKVRVGGRGLMQATANELNEFFVNTRDAGNLPRYFII